MTPNPLPKRQPFCLVAAGALVLAVILLAPFPAGAASTGSSGPSDWSTILAEGFEGAWPGGDWIVFDNDATDNGEYFWAKRACRAHSGSFGAWGVGGGANGGSLACGNDYPNNADSWMIYGPFDLGQATMAELRYAFWLNSECTGQSCSTKKDPLCAAASSDGEHFLGGRCYSGDRTHDPSADANGWIEDTFDLASFVGQRQVWIAFVFRSDASMTLEGGAFVDDILIRQWAGPAHPFVYLPIIFNR